MNGSVDAGVTLASVLAKKALALKLWRAMSDLTLPEQAGVVVWLQMRLSKRRNHRARREKTGFPNVYKVDTMFGGGTRET